MNPAHLCLPAPAKLNLFLHVTGRRADGYHTLQTVFQLLDFGDSIEMEKRDDGQLRLECAIEGVPERENLVYRAALGLQQASDCHYGANICIEKRLPQGGGLGGGSSDAATTLVGLNQLWNTGMDRKQLATIGLALGADVPVFVQGHSAWAEGVGETLMPIEIPPAWYLVIDPGVAVSTAAIFADKDLTRNTQPITLAAFLDQGSHNDCEPVARRKFPAVDEALAWLAKRAPARLTGTGGCIFAAFSTQAEADSIAAGIPDAWRWFIARGTNGSPLYQALDQTGTISR